MTRFKRLGTFAVLVVLALAALFFGVQVVLERHLKTARLQFEIVEKERAKIAIELFYAHYHQWPCMPGPLGSDAVCELAGLQETEINTEHINFFRKADCEWALIDRNGRELFFKPDGKSGTCTVYSETGSQFSN
jgi:hypothetical protein